MATPRVAAGALFSDTHGRTLLVKPTYKDLWDIPGGYVEPGESPRQACAREIKEELGLALTVGALLVIDWAPIANEGDKILFVFDGGELSAEQTNTVVLPADELAEFQFFKGTAFPDVLPQRLVRRMSAAIDARRECRTAYLENGQA